MSRMTKSPKRAENKKNREISQSSLAPRITGDAPQFGSAEHISLVLDGLDSAYGHESSPPDMYATGEPLDGLILTLLSQNTNDRNRDVAYEKLRINSPRGATSPVPPRRK